MAKSKIEWTDMTWNPVTGCTKISPGCQNCYAERMSIRLAGRCGYDKDEPFKVTLHPNRLGEPLRWKKPSMVFVCSMGDLFHEDIPNDYVDKVLEVIEHCKQHTFLILTKRPENIQEKLYNLTEQNPVRFFGQGDYLPNLWLGVTAENQEQADKRIPILLQIPAAVRFVSIEPMLSEVTFRWAKWQPMNNSPGALNSHLDGMRGIDWVICGCESGLKARPMDIKWARELKKQCHEAKVPFFLKQINVNGKIVKMPELDGKVWDEMPCN